MNKKELFRKMREDMTDDCPDFFAQLKNMPVEAEKNGKRKRPPIMQAVACGAFAVLIVGGSVLVWTNIPHDTPDVLPGISSGTAASRPDISEMPKAETVIALEEWTPDIGDEIMGASYPNSALRKAMDTAPEGAYFRVMIYVPGLEEFVDGYEENGESVAYYKEGEWKRALDGLPEEEIRRIYDEMMDRLNKLEKKAAALFNRQALEKYGSCRAAFANPTEGVYRNYLLVDVIQQQDIERLTEQGCRVVLALPERPEDYPDAVTERMALLMKKEKQHEVQIVLRLDSLSDQWRYSRLHYAYRRIDLPEEHNNEAYIRGYLTDFAADYGLENMEQPERIFTIGTGVTNCYLQGSLTNEQILSIAADERVAVICPSAYCTSLIYENC